MTVYTKPEDYGIVPKMELLLRIECFKTVLLKTWAVHSDFVTTASHLPFVKKIAFGILVRLNESV